MGKGLFLNIVCFCFFIYILKTIMKLFLFHDLVPLGYSTTGGAQSSVTIHCNEVDTHAEFWFSLSSAGAGRDSWCGELTVSPPAASSLLLR